MNARAPASSNFCTSAFAAGLAAMMLAGCADVRRSLSPAPVNVESPVAAQVQSASTRNYALPRLTDVPPPPRNVPTAPYVKRDVVAMVRCRGGVDRFALTHPPLSGGTDQFAVLERNTADLNPADIPPVDSSQRSDVAADQLRAYAAPPLAIASGPPPSAADAQPPVAAAPPASAPAHPKTARHAAAPAVSAVPASPPARAAAPAPAPVTTAAAPPPLPAPQPDPLLARCT